MYLNKEIMIALREGNINEILKNRQDDISIREQSLGMLNLPTGKIVANDPVIMYQKDPFERTVAPGQYPVMLYVAHISTDQRVAFAEIRFTQELPVEFELATIEGDDISRLGDDDFFGYGVDAGTGGFMDEITCDELEKSTDDMFDLLDDALEESYVPTYDTANVCLPDSEHNIVAFSSGYGDGSYPTFWGFDKNGELCSLITDFLVVDDDDDKDWRILYNVFLLWLPKQGWQIKSADQKTTIPSEISTRYKNIPAEWLEFSCSLESCSNSAENVWFLTADDYLPKDENKWRYNEFELISLEAAQDDKTLQNEITNFWNNHLPIVMSVANGYEYYAIDTSDGRIVHGLEPEFEKAEAVAASFSDFLKKIIDGEIVL